MSQTEKKPKRVVSEEEYRDYLWEEYRLRASSVVLLVVGLMLAFLATVGLLIVFSGPGNELFNPTWPLTPAFLGLGGISYYLFKYSASLFQKADNLEEVIPLTRHNTGHLPADTSLMRASSEPPIQPQDELLRAAHGGLETPPEQLLRPGE